jgi:hypothetical protein
VCYRTPTANIRTMLPKRLDLMGSGYIIQMSYDQSCNNIELPPAKL